MHLFLKASMILEETVVLFLRILAKFGSRDINNIGTRFENIMMQRLSIVTADQQGPLQVPLSESTSVMIVD